jgi:hypothetical protein
LRYGYGAMERTGAARGREGGRGLLPGPLSAWRFTGGLTGQRGFYDRVRVVPEAGSVWAVAGALLATAARTRSFRLKGRCRADAQLVGSSSTFNTPSRRDAKRS